MALAPSYPWMIAACMALGIGETTIMPAGMSLIWDIFPVRRRGIALSALTSSTALGVSASVVVPSLIYDTLTRTGPAIFGGLSPWRETYLLIAMGSVLLVLPLALLREPVRRERVAVPKAGRSRGIGRLWRFRARLGPMLIASGFIVLAELVISGWLPTVMIRDFGLRRSDFAG